MITNNTSKHIKQIICESCDFKCCKKGDYNRHITTAKHKMIMNDNPITSKHITAFCCDCGKTYKYASGLSRHKIVCSFQVETERTNMEAEKSIISSSENKERVFLELMSKNNDLMEMLQEQSRTIQEQNKTINEMIPKIGSNNNNNNINTTNNNQFNLQVFLNEDCKEAVNFSDFIETIKVSFADLENQAENGYIKGISKLFIESLQSLGINKRPIHCTDKKRKTLYIKENDAWDKEGSQDTLKKGIQEVSRRTFEELIKSQEDNAEAYKDADSEFSEKCISIQRNLVPAYPRETTINKVIEHITQKTGIL
jgi:hypothetical protein